MRRNFLLIVFSAVAGFAALQAYAGASGKHVVVREGEEPPREDTQSDPPISISSSF
jgi:hypothetical protein